MTKNQKKPAETVGVLWEKPSYLAATFPYGQNSNGKLWIETYGSIGRCWLPEVNNDHCAQGLQKNSYV